MTNKFRFWAPTAFDWTFRPHKVYIFELSIKFYIKSSTKTSKFHVEVKKEPKTHMTATQRNLFLVSKMKANPTVSFYILKFLQKNVNFARFCTLLTYAVYGHDPNCQKSSISNLNYLLYIFCLQHLPMENVPKIWKKEKTF
jgi:hypothetical protein